MSKGETKRTVSWLERQFTTKATRDYDSSNAVDYPTAVAVAAFVVKSIEDKSSTDQIRTNTGANKPLSKIKSKVGDTIGRPEKSTGNDNQRGSAVIPTSARPKRKKVKKISAEALHIGGSSVRFQNCRNSKNKIIARAVKTSKSSSKVQDKNVVIRTATVNQEPVNSARSLKQSATFVDTKKNSTFADKNIDIASPKTPTRQSTSQKEMTKGSITMNPGVGNSKADIWEKEEMKKIKERYEKLNKVILDWETKKKKKAKRHFEQIEAKSDTRRAETRQSFDNDNGRIENIAGRAKAQAEKNQEKEELKVKEKANKIRSTGKMPSTCLCL